MGNCQSQWSQTLHRVVQCVRFRLLFCFAADRICISLFQFILFFLFVWREFRGVLLIHWFYPWFWFHFAPLLLHICMHIHFHVFIPLALFLHLHRPLSVIAICLAFNQFAWNGAFFVCHVMFKWNKLFLTWYWIYACLLAQSKWQNQ